MTSTEGVGNAPTGNTSYVTVEHDGWTADSNRLTEDQVRTALEAPSAKDEAAAAAAKLGQLGGKAAAEARKTKPVKADEGEDQDAADAVEGKAAAPGGATAKPESEDEKAVAIEKRKRDARERVLQATREAAELKRQLRERDAEIERLRTATREPLKDTPPPAADDADDEPTVEAYDAAGKDFQTFLKDHTDWAVRKALDKAEAERSVRDRQRSFQSEMQKHFESFDKQMSEAGGAAFLEELVPELQDLEPSVFALADGRTPNAANALADECLRSADAPRLMRFLSAHPDVIQRLSTLRPREFEREMGKIESKLEDAATAGNPAPKPSSQAPRPARPVAGTTAVVDAEPDPRASSYEEHASYYNALERRRRRSA